MELSWRSASRLCPFCENGSVVGDETWLAGPLIDFFAFRFCGLAAGSDKKAITCELVK